MKRFAEILSAAVLMLAVAGVVPVSAQDGKEDGSKDKSYALSFFKVGIKGGIDFISMSRFELGYISESVSNYTGFTAGVAFSFDMPLRGMTIQPELNYVSKGAMYRGENPAGGSEDARFRTDYIELPVNFQFGLDLILLRPYLMVSPYIGYAVYKDPGIVSWDNTNRFEYGIGIGGGVDFWKFQLQVKYNWNIGQLARNTDRIEAGGAVRMGNYRGLEVNLVFFF
ncbi:MAG TPA: PorT family protein [Candidatus Coprenecus pullicola]|nr:PorT family protein [Candidatus Coprenecus pullicola]